MLGHVNTCRNCITFLATVYIEFRLSSDYSVSFFFEESQNTNTGSVELKKITKLQKSKSNGFDDALYNLFDICHGNAMNMITIEVF